MCVPTDLKYQTTNIKSKFIPRKLTVEEEKKPSKQKKLGYVCEKLLGYGVNYERKPGQNLCSGHGTMHHIFEVNAKVDHFFLRNIKLLM